MSEFLFQYEKINPISWAYLSSLLMIALFFKFNRFWSVRNLDLILLILLAPGLLIVQAGRKEYRQVRLEKAALTRAHNEVSAALRQQDEMAEAEQASYVARGAETGTVNPSPPSPLASVEPPAASAEETKEEDSPPSNADIPPPALLETGAAMHELAERETAATNLLWRGYAGLLAVCGLLLIRLLFDATMVRRPLLEPNMSTGGLLFLASMLFVFLMANVITSHVTVKDVSGAQGAKAIIGGETRTDEEKLAAYRQHGPSYFMLHLVPSVITPAYPADSAPAFPAADGRPGGPPAEPDASLVAVSKTMAILAHLAILAAMIFIGYWHFENIKMGIGAATLYLILPYTSQMTGHVDHVLPSALLLWAIVLYRRPAMAGLLIGVAMSAFYYPFFLLPLWLSFYWQRGVMRFLAGLLLAVGAMVASLAFVSNSPADFWTLVQAMFGLWMPKVAGLEGIWANSYGWDPIYRLPVIATCVALGGSLALWPAQKNLGTLLSCSAAMMIAIQFWHGHGDGGGMYLAWFLPLALLTVFRPNLEDRVALTVLGEDWFTRRRAKLAQLKRPSNTGKDSMAAFSPLKFPSPPTAS
ncbi:MAG: hypothetical protein ACR2FY_12645 [Pirellulaceae bacterium]